jgi:hypothetical protein
MTLWDLLTTMCFVMPISGGLASAKLAKGGFGGYSLAIAIGLALGVGCAWTMRAVGEKAFTRLERYPAEIKERYLRALYFAVLLWAVFGLFLGGWVSSAAMRQ